MSITVQLTPVQISAVEIYLMDPAHDDEEWAGKISLTGRRATFACDLDAAIGYVTDAANSASEGDSSDMGAWKALCNVSKKLRSAAQ